MDPDDRFYLQVNRSKKLKDPSIWYKDQPLGKNSIGDLAKTMSTKGGLKGKKTNHGGRRTAITTLVHNKVPPNYIMQLSGHKNVQSINNYSTLSIIQQKEMSNMLSDLQMPLQSNVSNPTFQAIPSASDSRPTNDTLSSPVDQSENTSEFANLNPNELNGILESIENFENVPIQSIPVQNEIISEMSVQESHTLNPPVRNLPVKITEQGVDIQAQHTYRPSNYYTYPSMVPLSISFTGANISNINISHGLGIQQNEEPKVACAKRQWKRIRVLDSQSEDEDCW